MISCEDRPVRVQEVKVRESFIAKTADGAEEMRASCRVKLTLSVPEHTITSLPDDLQDLVRAQVRSTSEVSEGKATDKTTRRREFPTAKHRFVLSPGKAAQMLEITGQTVLGLKVSTVNGVVELGWQVEAAIPVDHLPLLAEMVGEAPAVELTITPLQNVIKFMGDAAPEAKAKAKKGRGKSKKDAAAPATDEAKAKKPRKKKDSKVVPRTATA